MMSGRPMYVEYGNDVEGSAFQKSNAASVAGTRWNLQVGICFFFRLSLYNVLFFRAKRKPSFLTF